MQLTLSFLKLGLHLSKIFSLHRAKVIGLICASVKARKLLLQALDFLVCLLDSFNFLLLQLKHLGLNQVVLLLKFAILAAESVLKIFECFTLLLILAFPKFFLARDSLNLRLSLIHNLLLAQFEALLKTTRAFITGLLQLLDLAVHELDLLGQKCLLATTLKFKLHGFILNLLQLTSCLLEFLIHLGLFLVNLVAHQFKLTCLLRQGFRVSVKLVSDAGNLLVLVEVLRHETVNSGIEFNALGLKMLNLLVKG